MCRWRGGGVDKARARLHQLPDERRPDDGGDAGASGGFPAFRKDIEGNFFRALELVPELAERVRAASREERWYGTADLPNVFRRP